MKSYFLLRNNRESGPYTERELKNLPLYTTDLVWVNGESKSWQFPNELEEFSGVARPAPQKSVEKPKRSKAAVSIAPVEPLAALANENEETAKEDALQAYSNAITEDTNHYHFQSKKQKIRLNLITANLFGLGVLLFGAMLCAFVVKKLVDQFEYEPTIASAKAIEIQSSLPVSTTAHAAKSSETLVPQQTLTLAATTTVESPEATVKTAVKPVENPKALVPDSKTTQVSEKENSTQQEAQPKNEQVAEVKTETEAKQNLTETDPASKKKPSLNLSANDYKVGIFGGISDLALTVYNPSSVTAEKATIEVEFLKPNGSVVKSQTLTVENIPAGGSKTLQVPSSNRGVKVRYHLAGID